MRQLRAPAASATGEPLGGRSTRRLARREPASGSERAASGRPPPEPPRDAQIVRVLIHELEADPVVAGERIDTDSERGIVTLRGEVNAPLAKQRAVALAQVVRGVRAVVDRMSVTARAYPDPDLELLAASVLAADAVTASEAMGASARAGVVRLTGVADSNASRRIAEDDVLALRGVLQVIDDLAVEPARRTDAQVASEVDRILRDDVWLDASQVEESVSRGVVTLTGSVKSAAEKARAEDDALAGSPEGVNVVALRIDPIDDGTSRSDGRVARTDDDLTAALLDAYARDPRVHPFVPGLEVRSGVAVLTGTAPDPGAARAAAEDARNVTGMEEAHDDLNAPAKGAESDATVLNEARGAIDRDPALSARGLTVEVLHGRLALRGSVASESERRHAISVAASVRGVLGVDDDLVIDAPKLTDTSSR